MEVMKTAELSRPLGIPCLLCSKSLIYVETIFLDLTMEHRTSRRVSHSLETRGLQRVPHLNLQLGYSHSHKYHNEELRDLGAVRSCASSLGCWVSFIGRSRLGFCGVKSSDGLIVLCCTELVLYHCGSVIYPQSMER